MTRKSTLLDLVFEVSRRTGSDAEVVEKVVSMVDSGRVRLTGTFRNLRSFGGSGSQQRARSSGE